MDFRRERDVYIHISAIERAGRNVHDFSCSHEESFELLGRFVTKLKDKLGCSGVFKFVASGEWADTKVRGKPGISLSLTRYYCVRSCAAFVERRREDRQICVAASQRMEADLTIPDGCNLAAQKAWRCPVFRGRPDGVYDSDASAKLECRSEVI